MISLQPGGVASWMGQNSFVGMLKRFESAKALFIGEVQSVQRAFHQLDEPRLAMAEESKSNRKSSAPGVGTNAVLEALFSETQNCGIGWEQNGNARGSSW